MKPLLKNWLFKNKTSKFHCSKPLSLKAKGLFAFFMLILVYGNAQNNLVPNPSFEDTIHCPVTGQISAAANWYSPTTGTPDLYHECASRVPMNGVGFQYPQNGKCYSGMYTFATSGVNRREYLQVHLSSPLVASVQYCVSFYVSLCDSSRYAVDGFGALLTASAVSSSDFYVLPYTPQISNTAGNLLQDKGGWSKVSGSFTATGGEQYLTIGNFKSDTVTDTLFVGPSYNSALNSYAYYYVDAISVLPGGSNVDAGNDTSVVIGDSVFIGEGIDNFNCNWYNSGGTLMASNTAGMYVHPTSSTYYVVEQNLCGTITYDTVNVNVTPVGITEHALNIRVNLYPNPNNGEFTIELSDANSSYRINIADIQGRIIYEEVVNSKKSSLHPDAENGVYLVHITNLTTNETFIKKLVIQK